MIDLLTNILTIAGVFFIVVAGIALVRMPDVFLRMSAATKGSTLGLIFIMLATGIYFGELGIATRAIATIIFVFLTAPVSAHMIARAAYSDESSAERKERVSGYVVDQLQDRYDQEGILDGPPAGFEE